MSDNALPGSFHAAWFANFTESKWAAFAQTAVAVGLGGIAWYQWAGKQGTTTTEVFFWMVALLLFVIGVGWFHARNVWKQEHDARVTADDRFAPRPLLVPRYEDDVRRHNFTDSGEKVPIAIENRGHEDAINIRIDDIDLMGYTAKFPRITHRIVRDGGTEQVVPDIYDNDPAVLEVTSHDLGWTFNHFEVWHGAERGEIRVRAERPFHVTYEDLHGRQFETNCVLDLHRVEHLIDIRYVDSRRLTP
jgi:hypothetical protein